MTEREWNACTDPQKMLSFLREREGSPRKLLLFACACFRRFAPSRAELLGARAAEVVEAYADGDVPFEETVRMQKKVWKGRGAGRELFSDGLGSTYRFWNSPFGQRHAAWQTSSRLAHSALALKPGRPSRRAAQERDQARAYLLALVRDVAGNPFRPAKLVRSWRTPDVVGLADGVYEERAFERMPVLGDALEDAGCADAEVLAHCRGPGPHARACWVLDLLLGKEGPRGQPRAEN
jgi:hypothetical protein